MGEPDDGLESEPLHPVRQELDVSHRYADPDAFDIDEILDRLDHYSALRGLETDPTEIAALDVVVARLEFEFARRLHDEYGPKPGDDDHLDAYDDPLRIAQDFEDPLDEPGGRSR